MSYSHVLSNDPCLGECVSIYILSLVLWGGSLEMNLALGVQRKFLAVITFTTLLQTSLCNSLTGLVGPTGQADLPGYIIFG